MSDLLKYDLTEGKITAHLTRLTIPMVGSFLAMSALQLTDAFFVSRLGTAELAALSFTFPVSTVIISTARGLGMGVMAGISHAIGSGNDHRVRRLATDTLILTIVIVSLLALAGILTIDPLFRVLGAEEATLPLIRKFMFTWYLGVSVLFIPMICNHAIRALGNTFIPSILLTLTVLFNLVLDPLLIFGLCGFPRLGLEGAALATVISRTLTMVPALAVMHFKYHLISFQIPSGRELFSSWRQILKIAVPNAGTNILQPVSNGMITAMAAIYGTSAVAALGAGNRILMFCATIPASLSIVLVPLIGQNLGRKKIDRCIEAWRYSVVFSMIFGVVNFLFLLPFEHIIAGWFSSEIEVVRLIVILVNVNIAVSAFTHINLLAGTTLNALGQPFAAAITGFLRYILLTIPLAYLFGRIWGVQGIFYGLALAAMLSGFISWFMVKRSFRQTTST